MYLALVFLKTFMLMKIIIFWWVVLTLVVRHEIIPMIKLHKKHLSIVVYYVLIFILHYVLYAHGTVLNSFYWFTL